MTDNSNQLAAAQIEKEQLFHCAGSVGCSHGSERRSEAGVGRSWSRRSPCPMCATDSREGRRSRRANACDRLPGSAEMPPGHGAVSPATCRRWRDAVRCRRSSLDLGSVATAIEAPSARGRCLQTANGHSACAPGSAIVTRSDHVSCWRLPADAQWDERVAYATCAQYSGCVRVSRSDKRPLPGGRGSWS